MEDAQELPRRGALSEAAGVGGDRACCRGVGGEGGGVCGGARALEAGSRGDLQDAVSSTSIVFRRENVADRIAVE